MTFRERNNLARRQCYQRVKEKNDGKEFELFCVAYHGDKYGHQVWHSSLIPEEQLYNAGIIHDYNKHRQYRLVNKHKRAGKPFYTDYGIDFLSCNQDGRYHAGQCKHYTSNKVCASDIGTFLSVVLGQVKNTAYLYTTANLETNLQECVDNMDGRVIHELISFQTGIKHSKVCDTNERLLPLRDYQKEALKAITGTQKEMLGLGCALGKTLIAGHVLSRIASSYKAIICVAPLRASVDNLRTRLMPFLPSEFQQVLVDCDNDGTTDINVVDAHLNKTHNLIIFTTFKSFVDVVSPLLDGSEYLLCDEVHNITEVVAKACNKQKQYLMMSATITEEVCEMLEDAKIVFHYGLAEGIKNGFTCDYEVVLPYLTQTNDVDKTIVDVDIPFGFEGEFAAKSLFLVTGMLQTGSRRCIVYLTSCAECNEFVSMFARICHDYHGLSSIWAGIINYNTNSQTRQQLLHDFQQNADHDLYVIACVRILDEAIDVPRCDSEFITCISGTTSEVRTVQRLQRGGRLDPCNPTKKNHLFLWTTEWCSALSVLDILKNEDPEFHKKVRVMSSNYDTQAMPQRTTEVAIQTTNLSEYICVKAKTASELWEMRRQEWIAVRNKIGKNPSKCSKDDDEKRAGIWQNTMRTMYKKGKLTDDKTEILNKTEGWVWRDESLYTFEEQLQNWIAVRNKIGKNPSKCSKNDDEKRAGKWQSHMRGMYSRVNVSKEEKEKVDILNKTEGWVWRDENIYTFEESHQNWIAVRNKIGKNPSQCSKDDDEKRVGKWQDTMRTMYKKGELTDDKKEILNKTEGWVWRDDNRYTFEEQLQNWIAVRNKIGKNPSKCSKDDDEKRAGIWQGEMRRMYKKGELTDDKTDILNKTEDWVWRDENIYTFEESHQNWIAVRNKIGKNPSQCSKDDDEKRAGNWQGRMRKMYKKSKLSKEEKEKVDILNKTEGWVWRDDNIYTFEESHQNWIAVRNKIGKNPSMCSKDDDEKRAGTWQEKMRKMYKKKKLSKKAKEKVDILNKTEGWVWAGQRGGRAKSQP